MSSSPSTGSSSSSSSGSPTEIVGSKVGRYTWKIYSKDEVAKHNKETDMWVIIHGRVFDVTTFAEDHPGGPEILAQHAGSDSTQDFEETFHSPQARQQLKDYAIGSLEDYTGDHLNELFKIKNGGTTGNGSGGEKPPSSSSWITYAAAALILAIAIVAYLLTPK